MTIWEVPTAILMILRGAGAGQEWGHTEWGEINVPASERRQGTSRCRGAPISHRWLVC